MGYLRKVVTAALIGLLVVFAASAKEAREVYWEELMPEGFNALLPPPVSHDNSMAQLQPDAPLVESLDGEYVKIPGFVVPLEGTLDNTTEFLLVPYFGACIHVPPPPSNQIVYVRFEPGVPLDNLYDPIWVTGKLSTQGWKGDIASVGYTLQGEKVSPFDEW